MRLLLDTHVILWWLANDVTLGAEARALVSDPDNLVMVSAASAWEIGIKRALGKLEAPNDLEMQIQAGGFVPLPITIADALLAGSLPHHHDDPFDRMLIAQARGHGLTIVTRDPSFVRYGMDVVSA